MIAFLVRIPVVKLTKILFLTLFSDNDIKPSCEKTIGNGAIEFWAFLVFISVIKASILGFGLIFL